MNIITKVYLVLVEDIEFLNSSSVHSVHITYEDAKKTADKINEEALRVASVETIELSAFSDKKNDVISIKDLEASELLNRLFGIGGR